MCRSIGAAASSYSDFSVRGAANGAGISSNAPRSVFGGPTSFGSSSKSVSDISVRGAANGAAAGINPPRPVFCSSASLGSSSPPASVISVRGAAHALPSAVPSSRPAFGQPNNVGNLSSTSTRTLAGYGHYSAGGVPAFPGVHGGPNLSTVSGTQRRTPSTWSWTSNRS